MDSLQSPQLSPNTHGLSRELVQKIAQGDLAEIASLYAAHNEWWDSGSNPNSELLLQYNQLAYLIYIRANLLHTH
jgi:hypothetical protein